MSRFGKIALALLAVVVLRFGCRAYLVEAFKVPSAAMSPTDRSPELPAELASLAPQLQNCLSSSAKFE